MSERMTDERLSGLRARRWSLADHVEMMEELDRARASEDQKDAAIKAAAYALKVVRPYLPDDLPWLENMVDAALHLAGRL